MYENKGETYGPSQDGFVFSEPQIAAARSARKREFLIDEARAHRFDTAAA
jgi:hypothetical protein